MFKFKGISSEDMQVVIEEEEHFIARASQRYEMIEIEGRDGAKFNELGYSVVERPIYVQCLNMNKIDDILAWLDGEGDFEYKGRKTTARFYSELEPKRSSCIRIIDTTFIRDPFWYKANEDYQLVKDRKDKQASGEYIHVEDSSNCRAKTGISGNSEQETSTQGKNYFTGNKIPDGNNLGVTYGFDNSILKLNGTTTGTGNILEKISTKIILSPGSYKFRGGLYAGSFERNSKDIAIYLLDKNGYITGLYSSSGITLSNIGSTGAFTITESTELYVSIFVNGAGVVLNNTQLAILIAQAGKDEGLGTFEQFVPNMPSPDYPSEIKTVGDNVNLFDVTRKPDVLGLKAINGLGGGDYTKLENGYRFLSRYNSIGFVFENLTKGKEYTISFYVEAKNSPANCQFQYGLNQQANSSANKIVGKTIGINAGNTVLQKREFSFVCSDDYNIVAFGIYGATVLDGIIFDITDIKIEKGTTSTLYSPHGQGSVKVTKCNKNLFSEYIKGIWYGTTSYIANANTAGFIAKVNPNTTYTIKKKNQGNRFIILAGQEPVEPGKSFTRNVFSSNHTLTQYTFTTKEDEYYVFFGVYNGTDENELALAVEETQLEHGSTATPYEQHQEQSYIMPVQQEMLEEDYFDFNNEEEVHVWNKLVLTGDEAWYTNINSTWLQNNHVFATPLSGIESNGQSTNAGNVLKSNNFKCKNTGELVHQAGYYISYYPAYRNGSIMINHQGISTTTDFKTYLKSQYDAGTPVVVYYKLATPTKLAFTEEQKAVAKELNNARTYKNVTNITTDSIAVLDLDYFSVTDETIRNEGNIQSRPVLRLEKTVSEAVEITINDVRFKYSFNDDKYVDIDCENKTIEYEKINRNRNISIGYDFPKLNIGNNKIIMNNGDCIVKVIRKDRWL